MNRAYLLLRNNKQSGPYSLDELLALSPKPFDLIWIEGKSVGWAYPTEIETLKTFFTSKEAIQQRAQGINDTAPYTPVVKTSSKTAPVNIHVSLPGKASQLDRAIQDAVPEHNIERKVEELRRKVQEFIAESSLRENRSQTNYNHPPEPIEVDFTHSVHQQKTEKKKKFSKKNFAIALLFIALASGTYFFTQPFSDTNPIKVQNLASTPPVPGGALDIASVDTGRLKTTGYVAKEKQSNSLKKQHDNAAKLEKKEFNPPSKSAVDSSTKEKIGDPKVEPILEAKTDEEVTEEPVAAVTKEKKKTLAEKIDGFFEKIGNKKQQDPVLDDQPKTTEAGSERKSTRRDDETKPAEEIDIASLVDITANNTDNWMMGVKGLKLTLRNRSNETIKTAIVEVKYYNEQNSLLEKKLVYFTSIQPQKSLTIAAPDQRLAHHIDFKLLAVNIKEDSYVKQ